MRKGTVWGLNKVNMKRAEKIINATGLREKKNTRMHEALACIDVNSMIWDLKIVLVAKAIAL